MRKTELKELYKMMFPDYPDIVTVAQLQQRMTVNCKYSKIYFGI